MGSGAKSYRRKGFLIYEEEHKYFHHILGGRQSYITLHPIPLNFLRYEENFLFFFISVVLIRNNRNWNRNQFRHYLKQNICFGCFASTETESFGVSVEPKQTEEQTKQFDRQLILEYKKIQSFPVCFGLFRFVLKQFVQIISLLYQNRQILFRFVSVPKFLFVCFKDTIIYTLQYTFTTCPTLPRRHGQK